MPGFIGVFVADLHQQVCVQTLEFARFYVVPHLVPLCLDAGWAVAVEGAGVNVDHDLSVAGAGAGAVAVAVAGAVAGAGAVIYFCHRGTDAMDACAEGVTSRISIAWSNSTRLTGSGNLQSLGLLVPRCAS